MSLVSEMRDAFGRAKRGNSRVEKEAALTRALDELRPAVVATLARFAGQTVDELDATFELLPVGTRLALEQAGALEVLDDEGGSRFGVRALPFAAELVNAASERTLAVDDPEELAQAVAAVATGELALSLAVDKSAASGASDPDVIGLVKSQARAERTDVDSNVGWLRMLDPQDKEKPSDSLPEIPFALDLVKAPLHAGDLANVVMAVSLADGPMAAPPGRRRKASGGLPGAVPVRLAEGGRAVSFVSAPATADALLRVTAVHPASAPARRRTSGRSAK